MNDTAHAELRLRREKWGGGGNRIVELEGHRSWDDRTIGRIKES